LRIAKLKLAARALGVRRLDLGPGGGTVSFEERNSLEPATVVRMIQKNPREYRLEGSLKLRVARQLQTEEARFEFAAELLQRLAGKPGGADKSQAADRPKAGGTPQPGGIPKLPDKSRRP
jgi:transcription-repair coupling factor (superfamily II helicase)